MPGRTFGIASSIVPTRVSQRPHPVPIAIGRAVPVRSWRSAPISAVTSRLHQRLREHPDAFPQDIPILLLEQLANKRRDRSILGLAIVASPPCRLLLPERTHGTMRDGRFGLSSLSGLPNFHHVRGL